MCANRCPSNKGKSPFFIQIRHYLQKAQDARAALANRRNSRQKHWFKVLLRLSRYSNSIPAYSTHKLGFLLPRSVHRDETTRVSNLEFHRVFGSTLKGYRKQNRGSCLKRFGYWLWQLWVYDVCNELVIDIFLAWYGAFWITIKTVWCFYSGRWKTYLLCDSAGNHRT